MPDARTDEARPLRILQVLRAPVGGLFRHVSDLTRALAGKGHEIGIVADSLTADGLTESRLDALRPFSALGIHRLPMPRLLGAGDLTSPLAVRRLARRLEVDVLHGHGAKGGMHARLARMGWNRRVALYTPHGGVLNYKPGSLEGRVFRGIERALAAQTDGFVFESAFAQQAYFSTVTRPKAPSPVIHNGLAAHEFEPLPLDADARDFVFIGEFRPVKGIGSLLDALSTLAAPDGRPVTMIMAGDGPDFATAEAQIARLGLGERVTLAGVQPARAMLAKGRCLVVPSLAESLPYVVLEAAAAQLPVITTRVGGIPEIFGPTSARLLPPGDATALAGAMQHFLDDPGAAEADMQLRLGHIEAGFSVRRMTDAIEALYRSA